MRFNGKELKQALKDVKSALATKNCTVNCTAQKLTGISFKFKDGLCEIAACDGYRLHVKRIPYTNESEKDETLEFVIPFFDIPSNSIFVDMILSESKEICTVSFSNGNSFILKTLKGPYINYEKSIPEEEPVFSIAFNPKFLKDALVNLKGTVNLDFYGQRSPCVIRQVHNVSNESTLDESYNLVLPCNIRVLPCNIREIRR